jgi:hypothetical protein
MLGIPWSFYVIQDSSPFWGIDPRGLSTGLSFGFLSELREVVWDFPKFTPSMTTTSIYIYIFSYVVLTEFREM